MRNPASLNALMAPKAIVSLPAKSAVMPVLRASSRCVAT